MLNPLRSLIWAFSGGGHEPESHCQPIAPIGPIAGFHGIVTATTLDGALATPEGSAPSTM
jgi:hypothetical protein